MLKVKVPKGFLASLSEKCLKEIKEKASLIEFERSLNRNDYYQEYNPNEFINMSFNVRWVGDQAIFPETGFKFSEESMVSESVSKLEQLQKDSKELQELKKSLGLIKKTISDIG